MDSMNIESKILTRMISKVIARIAKQKIGIDISVDIRRVKISTTDNGTVHFSLEADGSANLSDIEKLIFSTKA